ncbi:MAG: hypothetical protein IT436_15880 [Phycisphaerales bacterium]|nr:hypothetical protein [Phycisphaerales bacterium]
MRAPGYTGFNDTVFATVNWDPDGPGPLASRLVAAGDFTSASALPARRIAYWLDGMWHPLGDGINDSVLTLTTWDADGDGPESPQLFAGGEFITAGTSTTNFITRWDEPTQSWQPLGAGFNNLVLALTSWDPDGNGPGSPQLIAAGSFDLAGGAPARHVARWDGSAWHALGDGLDDEMRTLAVWDRDGAGPLPAQLVIAGNCHAVGSALVNYVYTWDGTAWQPVGPVLDGNIHALTLLDTDGPGPALTDLVVGGQFITAGSQTVNSIARWDGSAWHPFDGGITTPLVTPVVRAVASWDPDGNGPLTERLVVGGPGFITTWWDADGWHQPPSDLPQVFTLIPWDPDGDGPQAADIVAAGSFYRFEDGTAFHGIAHWGAADPYWLPIGDGMAPHVQAAVSWDPDQDGPEPSQIVFGGSFGMIGEERFGRIARYNPFDGTWHAFGTGMAGVPEMEVAIHALTLWDPDATGPTSPQVVAAGVFTTAGGVSAKGIARWDAAAGVWRPFHTGFTPEAVEAVTTWDPDGPGPQAPVLVAAGRFTSASGATVNRIARWDTLLNAWRSFGTGLNNDVYALTSWDPDADGPLTPRLVAGGDFTMAGTVTVNRIAQWTGVSWQPFGAGDLLGSAGRITCVGVWDPDGPGPLHDQLIASGHFGAIGAVAADHIARWDGSIWHALGNGLESAALALMSRDPDGAGPSPAALVAGGQFDTPGTTADYLATWDGVVWRPFHGGVNGLVKALASWSNNPVSGRADDLFIGGSFNMVDGLPSAFWAHWKQCRDCPVDLNGDGIVDFADYLDFLNLYDAQDLRVDFNQDGLVDFSDYLEFLNLYDSGC